MNFVSLYFIVTIIVCLFCGGAVSAKKGGYKDIVVAIGKDVKEDMRIIDNIKRMFGDASAVLYNATKQKVFFKKVFILVPSTWKSNFTPGTMKSKVHVRIDKPHPVYGDSPYTLQQGGCGEPGTYIHLSSNYAANMYGDLMKSFGKPGKVLAHEWARLRWGVFNEYGEYGSPSPPFYIDEDHQVHTTGCVKSMFGWMRTSDLKKCRADATTRGLPDENCHFFPAEENNASASLMNLYFLDSVTAFCNNETHNRYAPNPQNLHCQGQSVWEVISQHDDIKSTEKSEPRDLNGKPSFQEHRVTYEQPKFLLYIAVNVSETDFIKEVNSGIEKFLRVLVPAGSQMALRWDSLDGVVSDTNFTVVDDTNREEIVNNTRSTHGNITLQDTKVTMIVIASVSESNFDSKFADMKENSNIINTISLSPNITDSLKKMADEKGGKSQYYKRGSGNLDSLLMNAITSDEADLSQQLFQVERDMLRVNSSFIKSINLDRNLGRKTRFIFSERNFSEDSLSIKVELISPDNTTYSEASNASIYQQHNNTGTIVFNIADAKPGRWTYTVSTLESSQPIKVLAVVTSYPREDAEDEPIRAKSWMSVSDVKYPSPCIVNAFVTQGYNPIVNANVTAIIKGPTSDDIHLSLHDNGIGSDLIAGDGQYSAYFTKFSDNGYYSVSTVVSTTDETTKLQGLKSLVPFVGRKLPIPKGNLPDPDSKFPPDELDLPIKGEHPVTPKVEKTKTEPFNRFVSGGIFKVEEYSPEKDEIPPGRVKDLHVADLSLHKATVTLTFSSSGDDYFDGTAHEMELRYHHIIRFTRDFEMGHRVNDTILEEGDLQPLPAGTKHTLKIKIPGWSSEQLEGKAFFFALRIHDDKGNFGETSNIASAYFPLLKYAYDEEMQEELSKATGLVVLVVLGIIGVIVVVFITTVKVLKFRHRKKAEISQDSDGGNQMPWTYENKSFSSVQHSEG